MKENKFVVDLGELRLSDDQRAKINASIQKAVSNELAEIQGSLTSRSVLLPVNKWPNFPIIWGFILRDFDKVIVKDSVNIQ